MNERISVIVPVYNTERFLTDCIESILVQSYDVFELLLIDDGSTDGAGRICEEYALRDARVKVIHKINGGLSSARNVGMRGAKGAYISFVDSDDTVGTVFLQRLYEALAGQEDASFAFCDSVLPLCRRPKVEYDGDTLPLDGEALRGWLTDHRSRYYVLAVIVCDKLYKREVLEGLVFPTDCWHEDEFFINGILARLGRCVFVPQTLFFYRAHAQSITGDENKFDSRHLDVFDAYIARVRAALKEGRRSFATATAENGLSKLKEYYNMILTEPEETQELLSSITRVSRKYYIAVFRPLGMKKKVQGFALLLFGRFILPITLFANRQGLCKYRIR